MKSLSVVGVDLAKLVFQAHGASAQGREIFSRRVRREGLLPLMRDLAPTVVAMEACGGAHYWARRFREMGHEVRLIAPQYVKPFVKTNKNDAADAEAIAEAAVRQNMRFVPVKTVQQQYIQSLHRIRQGLMVSRVALSNETRGLLAEYGVIMAKGHRGFVQGITQLIAGSSTSPDLIEPMREEAQALLSRYLELQRRIEHYDEKLKQLAASQEPCKRLMQIRGVGPLTATAMIAAVGDARMFKNGRQMAAWMGLVPRQSSSGGKQLLLGISKRGDRYLRTLLIHGARASLCRAVRQPTRVSTWATAVADRRGLNKAAVALANKNARMMWAILARNEEYRMPAQ